MEGNGRPDLASLLELGGTRLALFLDLDGTLLEIADHPKNVFVPDGLHPLLLRLHRVLGGAVAIVSGRGLGDIDRLLRWGDLDAAGCHGAECRINGITTNSIDSTLIRAVGDRIAYAVREIPKTFVEVKSQAVAIHYAPAVTTFREIAALADKAFLPLVDLFEILPAKNVVEVKPRGVNKAEAIRRFLKTPRYRGRIPVYVGDDLPDEVAFLEVDRRDGYSMRVGTDRPAEASFSFETVAPLRVWLEGALLVQLEASQEALATEALSARRKRAERT